MLPSTRAGLSVLTVFLLSVLVAGCAWWNSMLRSPCEQQCYSARSVEPGDFDIMVGRSSAQVEAVTLTVNQ